MLRKRNPTSLLESWDHRRLGGGRKFKKQQHPLSAEKGNI